MPQPRPWRHGPAIHTPTCYGSPNLPHTPPRYLIGGFGLRNHTSDRVRYLPVGVANSVTTLLADHESIVRSLVAVKVPRMKPDELRAVVQQAVQQLAVRGLVVNFEPGAVELLVARADGFPWFVHLLAQDALLASFSRRDLRVREGDIVHALLTLSQNEYSQHFASMYRAAVGNSQDRELTLRLYARWDEVDIATAEPNRILRTRLSVTNPAQALGQLAERACGPVLVRTPGIGATRVQFISEMFKIYVRMSTPSFPDADERLEVALAARS